MNETRKRGRPEGALSFVRVRMSDLQNFLSPNAPVIVSYKWLKELGMVGDITVLCPEEAVIKAVPVAEDKIHFQLRDPAEVPND